ncbi:YadA-like family protein [Megasphaera sp.]|uniref:YadA-like family protein n=2 Tax=Megasphaera sp. TaxID=2023260 RepID=UPI002673C962|nr:YadA-like family protein [uncultured Megasphaera sp.]
MNKIYKVVWNTVRNCYVVGSELISSKSGRHSTSNGKSSSLKVTLTVLALCGMTALGSGVAPAYAADGTGAVTAKNQYVALKFSGPKDGDSRAKFSNGQWHTTFNGEKYDTVDSGMRDRDNQPILYWVREGYSLTMVDGQPYTSLSSNGRRADVSWTGDANAKPSDILESVTSTHVQTNVTTNVGETLQQVNAGTYAGVSNSGGTEVDGSWNYIVKDSSWKGIVSDSNYRNGYADLVSSGKPRGFVRTTDAGSKLAWNATLSAYTYNGKVVDYSNIYVIDGKIGVFTNASGSEVYTGTVFGKNNEVLMTVKKSDGSYYSYWGAEVNDAGATMDTYRVAEYQKDLNVLRDNDFALYHNDIKSVDMSTNDSSATISLMRNGDGTSSPAVDGTLTITNGGGTGGNDTYVRISNTTNGQEVSKTFTTGSKVSAIGSTDATTGLTINGVDYTIKAGKDYKAGANIQISPDNTISATDTKYTAGANVSIDENNVISAVDTDTKYTAGKNITIDENNVISAQEYKAGTNVSIDENNKISAKNTTLTNRSAEKSVNATSGGVTYTIKDTDGNAVTLEDVASATTVNKLIDGAKVHYFSVNASANQGNYNNDGAGNLSIAIGTNTAATEEATAVGNNSTADEKSAAFGYSSDARGTRAVALGAESFTNGSNSTAIGWGAAAGYYKSDADQVMAEAATAVGSQAEVHANYGTAVGQSAKVDSEDGTALGMGAQIWGNSAKGVAVGRRGSVGGNGHSAAYGIALGAESQAEAENGIAIGYDAVVSQPNSVALGSHATTNPVVQTSLITIPNTNTTYNVNGTNPVGTVSVGSANGLRTITNVAAGRVSETSTDAVNGSELYAVATEAAKHTTITTEEGSRITVDSKTNLAGGTEYILDFDSFGLANSSLNNLTNQGKTVITNLAKEVERHIKPVTYAVDKNGTVTMTYVNGKGETVNNMTATITGIAKSDLSNITEEGDTYITQVANKAVKVIDGENTTVTPGKDGDVTTYAVNVDTSGKIEQNNTNIVTGDTVYNALQNVSWKAQVNGNNAKTVAKDGTLNFIDGDNIDITSNDNGDIKISTTGLASSGDLWTAQAGGTDVKAVNQKVNFVGSDHITVTGTDGQIKFEATGLADTDLTNITNDAITKIQNIAKGEDVHIKSDTYTVGNDGSVTMTYVDGNGNKVDGTAKITGIAKSDLTNITEGGKTVINNLAKEAVKVVDGTNTNVETVPTTDGHAEYKVNLDKDVNLGDTIYLNGSDGSISAKSGGAQLAFNNSGLTVSQAKNGLTNETKIDGATITVDGGAGNQTIINGSTARIGGVLVNGGSGTATISGLTNQTTKYDGFANGSGRAATEEQLKEVDSKAAAAKTTVAKGKNITVDEAKAADGSSTYTVGLATDVTLGDNAIKLNGSDGSISAKSGGAQLAFNNSGLTVSQAKNGLTNETRINGAEITVDGGIGNQTTIKGSTARIGSVLVNGGSGTATITGLTNKTTDYTGFANGSGRAATEEQLKEVAGKAGEAIETAGKGWNLTTNGKESSKTNIKPGGTVDFSSSNDNLLISNAGADLSFSLSDNLDLTKNDSKKGSVKVGENTTLTDGLLQVGTDVSLTASALNVGTSSLTTSALMVGGLTYINSNGLNANNRVISNVAAGILDTDAVNVGQLKSAISGSQVSIKAGDGISVAKTGNQYTINVNIEGVTNNQGKVTVSTGDSTSTESGSESGSSGAKKSQVMDLMYRTESNEVAPETTTDTGKAIQIESIPEDIKLEADDNQAASVVNGETIKIAGDGTNISTAATVTGSGSMDTISVSLKPDIQVDSVTINNGGPTINNTGIDMNGKSITNVENITVNNGPTINSSGIDMNSQKITNLADGEIAEGSTDAVNGGQLYNTNQAVIANAENINSLSHSLNKLDSRINRVGAGAAALAALHPLDFDPDNKWDFAAGYGNYAGANAVAIGTYYRPNENTMFSIGGSFGGGENMINAGVSFKLGSGGSGITTSKTVMAKKIKEQDELLKAQDAKMKEQDEKIAKLEALVAQQGEMIQQALGKK